MCLMIYQEEQLLEHWHLLQRQLEDVNRNSRNYVMDFSVQMNTLNSLLNTESEGYTRKEEQILLEAESTLEQTMGERFKEYRLEKLRAFTENIKHEVRHRLYHSGIF